MKKEILCLILTLVMVFSVIAGCSTRAESTESVASSTQATVSPDENTESVTSSTEATVSPDVNIPEQSTSAEEPSSAGVEPVEPTRVIEYPVCEPGKITLTYWMQWPPFLNGQYEPADVPFFCGDGGDYRHSSGHHLLLY